MKKVLSAVVAGIMALNMGVCSYAAPQQDANYDDIISVNYLYTNMVQSQLSISNKTATCTSVVRGAYGVVTKIVITQVLERKDGSDWRNYAAWGGTFNSFEADLTHKRSSLTSGSYRVKTVANVYKGSTFETVTKYSKTVSC